MRLMQVSSAVRWRSSIVAAWFLGAWSLVAGGTVACAQELPPKTALDDYVNAPDPSYRWKVVSESHRDGITTIVIDMVSQTWRTADDVDRPVWQHWLIVTVPDKTALNRGMLFISGGSNGHAPPTTADARLATIAKSTRSLVAELKMIPNQPLVFHGDGVERVEDDLIAYTWDQFLKTGDPTWPARNPMVKAAVRAMDTVTALTQQRASFPTVDQFVVAGGSKRGWTTWLTGAVDKRVIGIIPIVIDVLNVNANTHHHFGAYGFWAPAVGSYVEHGIVTQLDHPRMPDLFKLVDPWFYRHRLTMPKLMLNAAGDQFFPPDSSQYYFADLVGTKHLRYVPNADHSLDGSDAVETIIAWYSLILADRPLPEFHWDDRGDGVIAVTTKTPPKEVRLWWATNPEARDFRLETLGPRYQSKRLVAQADGTYVAKVEQPERGWSAYFVELSYDVGLPVPLKLTTTVDVVPDELPFKERDPGLPPTITIRCVAPQADVAKQLEQLTDQRAFAAVGKEIYVNQRRLSSDGDEVELHVNWKPVGRFEESAKAIAGWLMEHGCRRVRIRLESGPNHRPLE